MDLKKLIEPFQVNEIEWRVSRAGKKSNGELWAKILAYVTNRAIMERLDEVCGPENWKNEFKEWQGHEAVMCGISIKITHCIEGKEGIHCDSEWVTKWDAAENTDFEAVKGGISGSQKRAAVQWGIGRYLYLLEETWANISDHGTFAGQYVDKKTGEKLFFKFDPPALPEWAVPKAQSKAPKITPDTLDMDRVMTAVEWFKKKIDLDDLDANYAKIQEQYARLSPNEMMAVHEKLGDKIPSSNHGLLYRNVLKKYIEYIPDSKIPEAFK